MNPEIAKPSGTCQSRSASSRIETAPNARRVAMVRSSSGRNASIPGPEHLSDGCSGEPGEARPIGPRTQPDAIALPGVTQEVEEADELAQHVAAHDRVQARERSGQHRRQDNRGAHRRRGGHPDVFVVGVQGTGADAREHGAGDERDQRQQESEQQPLLVHRPMRAVFDVGQRDRIERHGREGGEQEQRRRTSRRCIGRGQCRGGAPTREKVSTPAEWSRRASSSRAKRRRGRGRTHRWPRSRRSRSRWRAGRRSPEDSRQSRRPWHAQTRPRASGARRPRRAGRHRAPAPQSRARRVDAREVEPRNGARRRLRSRSPAGGQSPACCSARAPK